MVGRSEQTHLVRLALCGALASLVLAAAPSAWAVVVGNPVHNGNTTAPADDPGWNNVPNTGRTAVYLGDQWVLSARHAVSFNPALVGDGLPALGLSVGEVTPIDNTGIVLSNPNGMGLTSDADLIMWRVNTPDHTVDQFAGTPESLDALIKPITLAAEPAPIGGEVTMIGRAPDRTGASINSWDVNQSANPWTWTFSANPFNFQGHTTQTGTNTKRWGTNIVEDDVDSVLLPNEANSPNDSRVNLDVNGVDVVTLITRFDDAVSGTANEAQGISGDSGGPVFYKRNGAWELSGVMHAKIQYSGQHESGGDGWAVFGNLTAFTDISLYRTQILDLLAQPGYSIDGDINLDGQVTGDGSGSWETDDVTAFVEGWLSTQAAGDVISWKRGDLDQNGTTNLADFVILRQALGGTISVAQLANLVGGLGGIPEPNTGTMLGIAFLCLAARRRPARRC